MKHTTPFPAFLLEKIRICKFCESLVSGRKDKIFCTINCKTRYHHEIRRNTKIAAKDVDNILHRNRSILFEITGEIKGSKKVKKILLDRKKFHFHYFTQYKITFSNQIIFYVYDFSYSIHNNQEVIITKL